MTKKQLKKTHDDIQKIVKEAEPAFFVLPGNENVEIPAEDIMYELRAEISDRIGMYFAELENKSK